MNANKDRVAESERVEERNTCGRIWRGGRKRHEENRMSDIPFGKSGSRTANEEQPDKLRKTVRFEQEAPSTSSSSTVHVSLEYPESGWTMLH